MALVVADGATFAEDTWCLDVVPPEQQVALRKDVAFEPLTAADRKAGNMYKRLNATTRRLIYEHPAEMRGLDGARQMLLNISVAVTDDASLRAIGQNVQQCWSAIVVSLQLQSDTAFAFGYDMLKEENRTPEAAIFYVARCAYRQSSSSSSSSNSSSRWLDSLCLHHECNDLPFCFHSAMDSTRT